MKRKQQKKLWRSIETNKNKNILKLDVKMKLMNFDCYFTHSCFKNFTFYSYKISQIKPLFKNIIVVAFIFIWTNRISIKVYLDFTFGILDNSKTSFTLNFSP